jgi:RNA polymerase sigma factor (sigma-70 family)
MDENLSKRPNRAHFATTHWSLVVDAGARATPHAEEALARLCEAYWYPLYAYVRRWGYGADEAQDLTQEFFARLMEKGYLRQADPHRGRFRSFLLAALKHFLANERDRAGAQKRGGGRPALPLEIETAEGRYSLEPADPETPETIFERRWALILLDKVLSRLRDEYRRTDRGALFDVLKDLLTSGKTDEPYARLGAELGMSEGAVKVAVHRLRRRFGELLREEIAQTVADSRDVDDEIRYLFTTLGA